MWPKILLRLLELAPHAAQLTPLANKYLAQRDANAKAGQDALAVVGGVRDEFTRAQAGLYRQMQEQSDRLSAISDEVSNVRALVEYNNRQLKELELRIASYGLWIKVCFIILILMMSTMLGILVRLMHA